ncbi:MAG: hypothetical protein ACPG77_05110, partial [Nannocystaceae bacterium]
DHGPGLRVVAERVRLEAHDGRAPGPLLLAEDRAGWFRCQPREARSSRQFVGDDSWGVHG